MSNTSTGKKIFFTFFILLLLIIALEIGTRIINVKIPTDPLLMAFVNPEWNDDRLFVMDSDLFWRFRPSSIVQGNNPKMGEYDFTINNLGFRGSNCPDKSAENKYRMMFLGDSCIFGWDAPLGKGFPEKLMEMLEKENPGLKCHGFIGGVPGYSTFQADRLLKLYGEEYDPKIIFLYIGTNDALPYLNYPDSQMMQNLQSSWRSNQIIEKSNFLLLFRHLFRSLPTFGNTEQENDNTIEPNWEEGPFRVSIDEFQHNLNSIVQFSRNTLNAEIVFLNRQDVRYNAPVKAYNKAMKAFALENGIYFVDVQAFFDQHPDPRTLYSKPDNDPVHPNPIGYEAIAYLTFMEIRNKIQFKID